MSPSLRFSVSGIIILDTDITVAGLIDTDLNPVYTPAVLVRGHGPFTWGKDAAEAVHNAVVLEEMAKMALYTVQLNPSVQPVPQHIQDKHFYRKHGKNAYYGQIDKK